MTAALLTLVLALGADPVEELNCLTAEERTQAVLYTQLQQQAYASLDRRTAAYDELKTPDDIRAYQTRLREFFLRQIGGLPERTPLNPQVVGTIDADGYRIEKVIVESQPQHHVTVNLYLPDGAGPFPGVVVSSGHSRTAKAAEYNQKFGIALAQHGIATLCFDPIGQGERSQILGPDGRPQFASTTREHDLIGIGSTLLGRSTARFRIWDGIRAIDYLCSRPEIDSSKIGYTGCSGGGTLTSYVMALDNRVLCAAPACYLTTLRRLIETIGPQDAEQNIYGQFAGGLDHPDYLLLRAPKPTLVVSTTGDYFDIGGAWDNFRQAKRVYARLGRPEQVDLVEVEGQHGIQPQSLATIVQWMQRWLLDRDEPVAIADVAVRSEQELQCTPAGQVLALAGERSVFDLNADYAAELAAKRQALWETTPHAELTDRIRSLLGIAPLADLPTPTGVDLGRIQRETYHIDRLVLRTPTSVLPGLTFHAVAPRAGAYLYLHDSGKFGDTEPDGPVEKLVAEDYVVVTLDLRGQGETARSDPSPPRSGRSPDSSGPSGARAGHAPLASDWKCYYLAHLLGRPLLGLHVEDALAAGHFVAYYQTDTPRAVHFVGVGHAGLTALHAAALRPDLFTTVTLRDTPRDWSSLIREPVPENHLTSAVHGALTTYDIPDLVRLIGEDRVTWEP